MGIAGVLRKMRAADVPAVMDVQEPASVAGLSGVFPQDTGADPWPDAAARRADDLRVLRPGIVRNPA